MKTDRFADIIRRKLDSIRPEFSERDWVRMQATLNQAGPSPNAPTSVAGPFAGPAAKLAVAGAIGTAVFLTTTIWQHYELKHLHQSLQEVSHKAAVRPETSPSESNLAVAGSGSEPLGIDKSLRTQAEAPSIGSSPTAEKSIVGQVQRDTVYVDRYVMTPAPATRPRTVDSRQSENQPDRHIVNNGTAPSEASPSLAPTRSAGSAQNRVVNRTDKQSATGNSVVKPLESTGSNPTLGTDQTDRQAVADKPLITSSESNLRETTTPIDRSTEGVTNSSSGNRIEPSNTINARSSTAREAKSKGATRASVIPSPDNRLAQTQPATPVETPITISAEAAQPVQPETVYETAAALPMQIKEIHWNELMAQRAKRMRPAPAKIVVIAPQVAAAAPASQPVKSMGVRFRIGAGTDINTDAWSNGLYSELIVGRRWSLGLGINRTAFSTTTFETDFDFNQRMHEDFRHQYAQYVRSIDPRLDILNIQTHTVRVQLPIYLSYRIPINQTFTVLPSVGANLNLQSQEHLSFIYRQPFHGYTFFSDVLNHPASLLNNMTFGTSVEWQKKHWVAQAGPVITVPFITDPSCQQTVTAGLRVRLFYQF